VGNGDTLAEDGGEVHGMTANAFSSVSLDPLLGWFAWIIRRRRMRFNGEETVLGLTCSLRISG